MIAEDSHTFHVKEFEPVRVIGLTTTSCGEEKRHFYKIIEAKLSIKGSKLSQEDKTTVLRLLRE